MRHDAARTGPRLDEPVLGTLGTRLYWCRNVLLADASLDPAFLTSRGPRSGDDPPGVPTQSELGARLASKLGRKDPVPAGTISRWEADKAVPDLPTILAIAEVCGVSPGWLAFGAASGEASPWQDLPLARQHYASVVAETRARQVRRNEEAETDRVKMTERLAEALREGSLSEKPGK